MERRAASFRVGLGSAALALLGACASTGGPAGAPAGAHGSPSVGDPRSVVIVRGDGSGRASWDEVVAAAVASDVVFLGENHGHPLGLAAAAALFEDVLAHAPHASLSLEFFERDEQSRLDDYLTGLADLETFERRTGRTPASFPPGHRAMVEAARKAGRPVHASNAPRAAVRAARLEGYAKLEGLTDEQRRLFRLPQVLIEGEYRERFDEVMTPHGEPTAGDPGDDPGDDPDRRERLDSAFRSQSLWDWTMADSVADALARGEAPVVHVVGRFHVDFDGGTAQALRRLRIGTRALTISFAAAWSDQLLDEDRGRADFVVYVGPSESGD
jgi:uncharacterized iron-regulated protein